MTARDGDLDRSAWGPEPVLMHQLNIGARRGRRRTRKPGMSGSSHTAIVAVARSRPSRIGQVARVGHAVAAALTRTIMRMILRR